MGQKADRLIKKLTAQGMSKSRAIRTLKSDGLLKQEGDGVEATRKGKESLRKRKKKGSQ